MKNPIIILWILLVACSSCTRASSLLLNDGQIPSIILLDEDDLAIKLASEDLVNDLEKIAGKPVRQSLPNKIYIGKVTDMERIEGMSELADVKNSLNGIWEGYRVFTRNGDFYFIGSDKRGTMWSIYHFIEDYLGIDPMYIWTDQTPKIQSELSFDDVNVSSDGPFFKFRGWFVNDEDFLTEWKEFDGRRNTDYKYYFKVIHPEVSDMIIESALRLRMNTIIPASFNDVLNPPEEYAIRQASQRGLLVSQHHQEPLGVGAFNFDNYYSERGLEPPFYSYLKNPEDLKEVWEVYAKSWSSYEDVIWQLSLRGRGDRAMWVHDPSIPKNDSIRGRLISEAIKYQYDLVKKYDPDGYLTLTLWLEIADLFQKGHINIPNDISIIFSDNSMGWGYTPDFYEVIRDPDKDYGIYYHHQLWGTGPHFIQGVSPTKAYEMFKEAIDRDSYNYCMLNVGNIREFVLGLKFSAKVLFNYYPEYNFEEEEDELFKYYFSDNAATAESIYNRFFEHYLTDTELNYEFTQLNLKRDYPYLLDGFLAEMNKSILVDLNAEFNIPLFKSEVWSTAGEESFPGENHRYKKYPELKDKVLVQRDNLKPILKDMDDLYPELSQDEAYFFDVNLRIPAKMFDGLMEVTYEVMNAYDNKMAGRQSESIKNLENALETLVSINTTKKQMLVGKWENWYRGEYKIRFSSYEEYIRYLIDNVN